VLRPLYHRKEEDFLMFCINCGANHLENDANYCSNCGKQLNQQKNINSKKVHYLIPIISLLIVILLLFSVKLYESKINEKVLVFQENAERKALAGEYDKALEYIERGLSYRNDYDILKKEKEMIISIKDLNEDLIGVEKKIMNEHFDDAQKEINLLKRQVNQNSSPLFINLTNQIEQVETSVKVGEIKEEINKLTTIDELADKLFTLYSLELQEASELKQQIYTKMVMISATNAEQNLENKHFNQAVNVIDEALQYVVNNEKLLSLKDRITEEKSSFEKAEQERIEKAMLAAKKEEERNLTKAVQVTSIKLEVDKYGDAYIDGKVKNNGTETVHSIIIEFTVVDKNGVKLEEGKTNVFPNKLEPGQAGNFEHVTYSAKENAKVNINNISWLLEEKKG
jgi:predicted nucleic acid-binding Zn ribbon protein